MQSASARSLPGLAWQRTRKAVPAATLWSALITFLLILTIAKSTDAAAWVTGIQIGPMTPIAAGVLLGVLAVTPLPWWWCVSLGMALGPVVAGVIAAPVFRQLHPLDPAGLPFVQAWASRVADGTAFADSAFVLFIVTWLMWVTGAWLSWCVLRWRQPLIGLIPGAAAFATNVLNFPNDQNGYTLAFLVLTFALLLWTNYTGSVARATTARVKLTGDARWDFWESGLVATAALIVLGIMLPPLSTEDRTVTMESSLFDSWAQLQQQLNHPDTGNGNGTGIGVTGFSTNVSLGGALKKSKTIVFTYTVTGQYLGPKYFRGVNITQTNLGEWRYQNTEDLRQHIAKGDVAPFAESYSNMAYATFTVNMISPPGAGNIDILFYPGQDYHVDRDTMATEMVPPPIPSSQLVTIDRLSSQVPPRSSGTYNVTVGYPDVSEVQLRNAGTEYSDWLQPYIGLPGSGYRAPAVQSKIHDLALQITAGKTNPYDQAMAIQSYLRSGAFRYTLTPNRVPFGVDAMDFFLFNTQDGRQGYCEYFASAMGDMLRSLGIPTRLVNGFGEGLPDNTQHRFVVRGEDAHTWVESYFPGYGWIPFEPTNDGKYFDIPRVTSTGTNLCLIANNCASPTPSAGPGSTTSGQKPGFNGPNENPGGLAGPGGFRVPDASTITRIVGVLLALVLVALAVAVRYLRPRTVMGVWKRTLVLARLAGATLEPGETPLELSRRLARAFPEAAASVRSLTTGFVVAAYAPPDMATSTRAAVMEAWTSLRPLMLRRVAARFRPGRA